MSHVTIVTDSASDMALTRATELGIVIVPLLVNFGQEAFRSGVDLSIDDFWRRMTAPDSPFPTTAACSPGDFLAAYEAAFAAGADSIVSVHVAGTLSGTIKSAEVAKGMLPDREIHIVDSMGASMAEGVLAELAVDMARLGVGAGEIARVLEERRNDVAIMLALDTITYLKRGGRISGASAAIGTLLSVKPIIEVKDGKVETVDKVRTRAKARERLIELLCVRPMERLCILHTTNAEVEAFRDQILPRVPGGIDPANVTIDLVGPSIGPHLGPGCVGAVALYRHE
ncbi:MAG TPA: DegV family protein [Candidatus Sulfomarinibacteraceae bacterium]|nr:DegV family protein [Candidatus Sulfomarinibacteraceae bacterium]